MEIKPQVGITDARQLGYGKFAVLGIQHLFAMFGATILVPALTGLSVSATLLFAGIGTLVFHLISKRMVPAFLGSSFDYVSAIPCFVCISFMPLTYSISDGILMGLISWVLIHTFSGRYKELNIGMIILAILFILKYAFL